MSSPTHARLAQQGKAGVALRLLLAAALAGFLLVFAARTLVTSPVPASPSYSSHPHPHPLPLPVAEALVHYATSNATPQQTAEEIGVALRVLQRRAPCNFLVFGLGLDSPLWAALNHGGRTVFLEEDAAWITSVRGRHPALESHHVAYDTALADADALLGLRAHPACVAQPDLAAAAAASCRLALRGLPPVFAGLDWDLVMVDAPTGWTPRAPGRMGAIYTAGMAARARRPGAGPTHVFVHDVDRSIEDAFSRAFLCEGYLAEQVGRIRHFVIPSHRDKDGTPFCP
uniref:Plant-specific domain TIGR01627 family protein n=1 Tax=Zea mays TaxID=4577 RepID=B6SQR8_MAIZE|nr:plant-specific domain TIGR01627 family protein [Zea mays]|eukprot:NP_001147380.1 plant-specific domain TIGR01627 family protein [Zea mays]